MKKSNFRVVPDYQTLAEVRKVDKTGKYIESEKVKQYNYKIKLVKEGLKVVNKISILEFNTISMESGKAILPIMNIIFSNVSRTNILEIGNKPMTSTLLMEFAKVSRPTVSKYIKRLVDSELIKRHGKNFMLSPYVFYPYVSDINLRILQEYWDSNFEKSKEQIGSEVQVEINRISEDARQFIGASKTEFENLQEVRKIL